MTLEELLNMTVQSENGKGEEVIICPDFRVSVQGERNGGTHFIIHANGHNSETLDFVAKGDAIERLQPLSDEQIKHTVTRFLCWALPKDFNPDDGISFTPTINQSTGQPYEHSPQGTNLFDASQAEAMVRHMIEGMPK